MAASSVLLQPLRSASAVGLCNAPAIAPRRQAASRRRLAGALLASTGEQVGTAAAAAAAAATDEAPAPPPDLEIKSASASYDQEDGGGWEGAAGPQICASGLSSDEDEPSAAAAEAMYGAASCPLPTVAVGPGELEQLATQGATREDVLASLDGMVGNYEFNVEDIMHEASSEAEDAGDDLAQLMADLAALEKKAGEKKK